MMSILFLFIVILCSIQFTFSAPPTRRPTHSPTPKPSSYAPTPNPTVAPTLLPTPTPTFNPTLAPVVPLMTNPPDVVKNASSKGGKVAGAFLGILFAASIVYLWYTKKYGPVFNSNSVPDDELNIEVKNPISTSQHNNSIDEDKF